MQGPDVEALAAQLDELIRLVAELSEAEFARPTRCPGWSVAELVAHCEGMLIRLVSENAQSVESPAEVDRIGYYAYDPEGPREGEDTAKTFSQVIRDRVIDEVGGRSGLQLRASLEGALDATLQGVHEIPSDRVIKRSGHPRMAFGEFVASRNVEFGVHTMDIAHATGRPEQVHPASAAIIRSILDGLLGGSLPEDVRWDDTTYILIGTGRRTLGPDDRARLGILAERFPLLS